MLKEALVVTSIMLFSCPKALAFERVECMDRPDGSVYILKRIAGLHNVLDVRIYHGWQYGEHRLPGLPIGVEEDFLNARYVTRTARDREAAIAAFTPLENLIFNMDIVFHHRFNDCELDGEKIVCRARSPVKIGREWISELEFFYRTNSGARIDADVVYTVGIRGASTRTGLRFSSGRRYFRYGRFSQCLYLQSDDW